MNVSWFTVIGFYPETGQKYAGHFEEDSPLVAEGKAVLEGVVICGIIEGKHFTLDTDEIIDM